MDIPGLVNEQFANWKITIFNGYYKWSIFNSYATHYQRVRTHLPLDG